MNIFLFVASLLAICNAVPMSQDWHNFKAAFGRNYHSHDEERLRMEIFLKNKALIEEHNELFKKGLISFELGINEFADMTNEEFRSVMLVQNFSSLAPKVNKVHKIVGAQEEETVDWRGKGAVTPIKNQGFCGSCWAFSVIGSLESHNFIKTGELVPLSEQNLVDCARGSKYRNRGCGGGWMTDSFQYILDNGGIDTATSYPYEGRDGPCRFKTDSIGAKVTGYVEIPKKSEVLLKDAVQNKGPVTVAIDASLFTFQFYKRGVYYDPLCALGGLNHAVLAVGYGKQWKMDYWLIKNSWGTGWGDNGYIKIRRNHRNHCGIASVASYPTV